MRNAVGTGVPKSFFVSEGSFDDTVIPFHRLWDLSKRGWNLPRRRPILDVAKIPVLWRLCQRIPVGGWSQLLLMASWTFFHPLTYSLLNMATSTSIFPVLHIATRVYLTLARGRGLLACRVESYFVYSYCIEAACVKRGGELLNSRLYSLPLCIAGRILLNASVASS